VIFGSCVMLFHLANAALLPLVGQKLAAAHPKEATAMMSACIIAAQLVMLPIALLVGGTADTWGRKPLFLAGFAILPIRAVLYTFSDNSFWLIGVQVLDGIGAGIFGALTPLVIADIMRGTGRYNLAQGAIATVQGIETIAGLEKRGLEYVLGARERTDALVRRVVLADTRPFTIRTTSTNETVRNLGACRVFGRVADRVEPQAMRDVEGGDDFRLCSPPRFRTVSGGMSEQKVIPGNVTEVDDGSISWAIARFATAIASDEPRAVRQALDIARQRIHDTTTLLSDLLGELRFAEGARLAMRGAFQCATNMRTQ
jgi:Sugar (and other) transporter